MADEGGTLAAGTVPALGRIGVWTNDLDRVSVGEAQAAARELEALGYGAIWFPESFSRGSFVKASLLLGTTSRIAVATGIASIWARQPVDAYAASQALVDAFPGRFLLGLGASHAHIVEGMLGLKYDRPFSAMQHYLQGIDATATLVSSRLGAGAARSRPPRVLAALGPRMLELARDRAEGAHPYLVTPEHTALARRTLGPDKVLVTEQAVVLSGDREVVLRRGRAHLAIYLQAPNYRNSWLRLGFTEADFQDGGSERLVDAMVASGDEAAICRRVAEHWDAGASHVCIQALSERGSGPPLDQWRALAPALLG